MNKTEMETEFSRFNFFRTMLGDMDEPTAPYGLIDAQGDRSGVRTARREVDARLADHLRRTSRAFGVSAASLCHLAWALVLGRVCGRDDVVFGTVLYGRRQGAEVVDRAPDVIINVLPVRIRIGEESAYDSIRQTHSLLMELMRHEHAPLALAQRCRSGAASAPLFSAILNYRYAGAGDTQVAAGEKASSACEGIQFFNGEERTSYPLSMSVDDWGGALTLNAEAESPIDPDRICAYLRAALGELVESLEHAPSTPVRSLDVLPASERYQQVVEWNATETTYPQDKCVPELFEAQVEKTPDAIALVYQEKSLTYIELNTQANRLAHRLCDLGVRPGMRVMILLERSMELVVAQLAALKCGAAYVPIDPNFPDERQVFMANDSAAQVVVTAMSSPLPKEMILPRIYLDDTNQSKAETGNLSLPMRSEMTAYVMYTSGSTGKPKGVVIRHRGITRLVINCRYADFKAEDRVAFAANPAFDAATMEVWGPLLNGGQIVVIDREAFLDMRRFAESLEKHGITIMFLTTAIFNQYAQSIPEVLARLRILLCGGERNDPASFARVLEKSGPKRLIHCYGPTETTTFAITNEVREVPEGATDIPLGRPIGATRIYILDARRQPTPIGVAGEIYIGGDGVADGYLNRPETTAERFLPDPFSGKPDARLYKTGDLGRWRPDGKIEFLGRNDFQVKIRGFRVELGEIESRLNEHQSVKHSIVVASEDDRGCKRLVGYVAGEEDVTAAGLKTHLRGRLPEYMVPEIIIVLREMPLTANGKIDRKRLPTVESADRQVEQEYFGASTPTEEKVAAIWAEILGLKKIGVEDNYFELGGHSLAAMQIMLRIQKAFEIDLPMICLWEAPTISLLSARVEEALNASALKQELALIRAPEADSYVLSYSQKRMWLAAQYDSSVASLNVAVTLRVTGQLNVEALAQSLAEEIRRQHSLTTIYEVGEGGMTQRIVPPQPPHQICVDLRGLPRSDRWNHALRLGVAEAQRPFDLRSGLLLRFSRLLLDENEQFVLITTHNIAVDEWSVILLEHEIQEIHRSFAAGLPSPLPEPEVHYVDFAYSQQQWLRNGLLDGQRDYWRRQLAGAPASVSLPVDSLVPGKPSLRGEYHDFLIPASVAQALKALGDRESATVFMTLYAAFTVFLYRLTRQTDIVIGTNITNRNHSELGRVIGFFVNALALRMRVSGGMSFLDALKMARQTAVEAYSNQNLPHEEVIKELSQGKPAAPLFNIFFVTEDDSTSRFELPGVTVDPVRLDNGVALRDLSLYARQENRDLLCAWNYKTDLIDRRTIERWRQSFKLLIECVVKHPDLPVDELDFFSVEEKETQALAQKQREQRLLDRFKTIQPRPTLFR